MTERLPPSAIFKNVLEPLQSARDAAILVASLETPSYPVTATRELCVKRLKEAMEILGYELVDRVPGIDTEAANHLVNVIDNAGDDFANVGGRMDMAGVANA